jgi:hypothetical protein
MADESLAVPQAMNINGAVPQAPHVGSRSYNLTIRDKVYLINPQMVSTYLKDDKPAPLSH